MLAGLMSRWTSPDPCSASIPAAGPVSSRMVVGTSSRPLAIRSASEPPGISCWTRYGSPCSSPELSTGTTFGCEIFCAAATSRLKRRTNTSSCESSVVTTLTATGRPPSSTPANTMPMRPRPMSRVIRYGPMESPGPGSTAISGMRRAKHKPPPGPASAPWAARQPSLLLVDPGPRVYLGDFGLARDSHGVALTAPGQVPGTVGYMAPELLDGEPAGAATDIYGLACLAVETLTATVPYRRDTDAAIMYAHIVEPPPRVSERRAELPQALDDVIAAGLAKDPDDRPPTAGAFARDVLHALGRPAPACLSPAA